MEWISPKDELPNDGEIVIIKYKYAQPFFGIARFLDNWSTFDGDYKNIFLIMASPRFPKLWYFTEEYKKISRVPKNKVECWTPLKHPDITYEDYV